MPSVDWDNARWIVVGLCALYAAFFYRGDIAGVLKKLVPNAAKPGSSLREAAGSVLSVRTYFESVGCPEGVEAANKCWACLVHAVNPEHKA